ncbi:Peroxidase 27 [Acorus calamus]|uniref:Peroxidase n=1 Tax=Acorus calamus TaxID=4465 RepID=A0AAV9DVD3_ACOCL|nr:Peroxidase 27 [Acorus calamus]
MVLFKSPLQMIAVLLIFLVPVQSKGLKVGFYAKTCPDAEAIIRNTAVGYIARDATVAAPLLRLHFHDCFVRGCDGSVLLNSTKSNVAEKDAMPNQSLNRFDVIDAAKVALEAVCPGVVSCADIVALAAREAVHLNKGPFYEVHTGRRDGRVSSAAEALANLPSSYADIIELKSIFANKGLSVKDLAVLSGAHTIGSSYCDSFAKRIYNFTGKGDVDPSLDSNYVAKLRQKCKPGDTTTTVEMDPGSFTTFDTSYYKLVSKRRGLFHSDAALLNDKVTRAYVGQQVLSPRTSFFGDFAASMVKMGEIGVLTGNAGEIRRICSLVN